MREVVRLVNAADHDDVQTQRDLVGRHDILAGNVEGRLAHVEHLHLERRHVLPESVAARRQRITLAYQTVFDIGRIAEDDVEPAATHDCGKFGEPVEGPV